MRNKFNKLSIITQVMNRAFEMRKSIMKINFKLSIKKIQILSPEAKFRQCLNI